MLRGDGGWIGSQLQKPAFLSRLSEEAIHWNSKELENSSGSGSWMRSDTPLGSLRPKGITKTKTGLGAHAARELVAIASGSDVAGWMFSKPEYGRCSVGIEWKNAPDTARHVSVGHPAVGGCSQAYPRSSPPNRC